MSTERKYLFKAIEHSDELYRLQWTRGFRALFFKAIEMKKFSFLFYSDRYDQRPSRVCRRLGMSGNYAGGGEGAQREIPCARPIVKLEKKILTFYSFKFS